MSAKKIFSEYPEIVYQYKRNLLAFYLHTDIETADSNINELLNDKNSNYHRYFIYASGSIKHLGGKLVEAKDFYDLALTMDLTPIYEANILSNLAVLKAQVLRELKAFKKSTTEENNQLAKEFFENHKSLFICQNYDELDIHNELLGVVLMFKQALYKYEVEQPRFLAKHNNTDFVETDEIKKLSIFLSNDMFLPEDSDATQTLALFKNNEDTLKTISNLTEILFEFGEKYVKASGFWMKLGLQNQKSEMIPRHLVLCALIYSQLGQTVIAEGLYRKSLDMLKDQANSESKINLSFCLNMYGRLLIRNPYRKEEGQQYIQRSEQVSFSSWEISCPKLHYLDFDFN